MNFRYAKSEMWLQKRKTNKTQLKQHNKNVLFFVNIRLLSEMLIEKYLEINIDDALGWTIKCKLAYTLCGGS